MSGQSVFRKVSTLPLMVATVAAVCVFFSTPADAVPMRTRSSQEDYLKKYSYMGPRNPDPLLAEVRLSDPEKEFSMAIESFQRFAGLNMTGLVDEATMKMMEMPRCGVEDLMEDSMGGVARRRRRYTYTGRKWWTNALTYRFINYTIDLPSDTDVKREIEKAFKYWSDVTPLTFSDVTNDANKMADIDILFAPCADHGDKSPFDGRGGTLAHAYFPGLGIGGDVHFDDYERFTKAESGGTNLLQVAIHELGHSLGLGHSDNQDAIMAPFYRQYIPEKNLKLHMDDINGIQHIYGSKPSPSPTTTKSLATTTMTTTTTTTTTTKTTTTLKTPSVSDRRLADFCKNTARFDAIDVIDGVIHAFFGNQYLQLNDNGTVRPGFPKLISETFRNLPSDLDAVLNLEQLDHKVLFFKGSDCYEYRKDRRHENLQRVTIPECLNLRPDSRTLTKIDAAFVWSGNGHVFLVNGEKYYRYSTYVRWIYTPRPLSEWKMLPDKVSDAFHHKKLQRTYFFSGPKYYIMDDMQFAVQSEGSINEWLRCCNYRIEELEAALVDIAPPEVAQQFGLRSKASSTIMAAAAWFRGGATVGLLLVIGLQRSVWISL